MTIQKFNLDSKLDIIRNEVFLKNMRSAIADSFDEMNTWMGKVDDNVVEAIKDKAIKYNHLADNSVGYNQQKIHEGIVWNYGNINVDTVNKTVSINDNNCSFPNLLEYTTSVNSGLQFIISKGASSSLRPSRSNIKTSRILNSSLSAASFKSCIASRFLAETLKPDTPFSSNSFTITQP